MRLSIGLLAAVSLVVCASGLPVQASTTINFGDVTYTPSFSAMQSMGCIFAARAISMSGGSFFMLVSVMEDSVWKKGFCYY